MGLVLLDSSVLIALLDSDDVHSENCTKEFRRAKKFTENVFLISSVSIAESLVGSFKDSYSHALSIYGLILDFINKIILFDSKIAFRTAQIRSRLNFSLADAMIVATAEEVDAELWTCDKKLVNKFKKVKYLG